MIQLFNAQSGAALGTISEAQLAFLRAQLEEEGGDDQDYYLNPATIELFEQRGADANLIALLRQALGDQEDMDIRWEASVPLIMAQRSSRQCAAHRHHTELHHRSD